jgi:heat shock protein HslJ
MSRGMARSVASMAMLCCVFVLAGCSDGTDDPASSQPSVPAPRTLVGSWVLRLGDRDKPDELTLELRPDGTAVGTDRCNFIQANWAPMANPSQIAFWDSMLTLRRCPPDRPDVIRFLTSARLDEQDHLLVTASGREWTYVRQ